MASALSNRQNSACARKTLQTQRGRRNGAGYVRQWFRTAEPLGERRYENGNTHTHSHSNSRFSLPKLSKLDYQVSICSLIPPATAISKTQDRVDTSVWWKLPFSIFFIIYYVQSAIINKVCKPELWFLCSADSIIVLYICLKFHDNISNNF